MLHESVKFALQPLWDIAVKGFEVHVGGVEVRICHAAQFSYVAVIPEASDMLGTVHGVCARGETKRNELASTSTCVARRAERTKSLIDKCRRLKDSGSRLNFNEHVESMWIEGYTKQLPAIFNWPFSNLYHGLDPYNVFRFEAMHKLELGRSKVIKVFISDRLRSEKLSSNEFMDSN